MSGDNPFAEPDDSDRTVFIPSPGGKRAAPAAASTPPAAPDSGWGGAAPLSASVERAATDGPSEIAVGATPLLAAAAPLLQLLSRLRNTVTPPDAGDLRERAVAGLRRFETTAREAGVAIDLLRPAHFALCAALDDVALATPWGAEGAWAAKSLVSSFHQQVRSGVEFFTLLKRLSQSPATNLPVLELMYLCLSLGFMGQYRLSPRGPAELEQVREELFTLLMRQRPGTEAGLSPHPDGVDAPYRPRRAEVPVWVAAVLGLAVVGGIYGWSLMDLGARADGVLEQALAVPPPGMPDIVRTAPVGAPAPPPAHPPEPGALDRLRTFLKPELDQGLVTIVGTQAVPVIRIANKNMFASGSATLEPQVHTLLTRIGEALKTEPGPVTIAGYTDNQPIRTVKFPSNFQLSQARADAASALISEAVGDPKRIATEGRGDADPIADNATPAGRDQNRRIEVILRRQG
jgi:type VI secretion system protein ImpK